MTGKVYSQRTAPLLVIEILENLLFLVEIVSSDFVSNRLQLKEYVQLRLHLPFRRKQFGNNLFCNLNVMRLTITLGQAEC